MKKLSLLISTLVVVISAWIPAIAKARTIVRSDKYTIVKLGPEDFSTSRIEEDLGLRVGCLIESTDFDLPVSYDVEVEVVLDFSGTWEKTFPNAEKAAVHHLASLELNYVDSFGNAQFNPKMIRPTHFGPVNLFAETADKRLAMYGGSLEERRLFVHGPLVLPAGTTKINVGICDIAPTTSLQLHELQIRMRPVN